LLCRAFGDGTFCWSRQTQLLLLSHAHPPGELPSPHDTRVLLDRLHLPSTGWEIRSQMRALLLPGVDGDFAELVFLDGEIRALLLAQLKQVCAAHHVAWRQCGAALFQSVRWIDEPH
jgi:hypothetical protein